MKKDQQDNSEKWREKALCRGMDTNIFFPKRGEDTRPAKKICSNCPVKIDCMEYGFLFGEKNGIWGGLSERQMRQVRRVRVSNLKAS